MIELTGIDSTSTTTISPPPPPPTSSIQEHFGAEEQARVLGERGWRYAGLVQGQRLVTLNQPFALESGAVLQPPIPVAFKTWGKWSSTNAMVICHALSGSADVEDWW